MCKDCERDVRSALSSNDRFAMSNRKEFKIDRVDGDDVYTGDASKPTMHVSHVASVLHWLKGGHFICGISSGTTAVKTLLAGKQADCSRCSNNASEVWAVLVNVEGVRRDQQSGLAPAPDWM